MRTGESRPGIRSTELEKDLDVMTVAAHINKSLDRMLKSVNR